MHKRLFCGIIYLYVREEATMNLFKNILKVFALIILVLFVFVMLWRAYFSSEKDNKRNTENLEIEKKIS